MFPDISFFSYMTTTVSFVSSVRNMFIVMLNITSFNDIEKVAIKALLLVETIIILMINLTSIFNMIINSKFIIIISF